MAHGAPSGDDKWPGREELAQLMDTGELTERLQSLLAMGGVEELCAKLGADPYKGIPTSHTAEGASAEQYRPNDWDARVRVYGGNWFAEKKLKGYWELICGALEDAVVRLLIVMATIILVVEILSFTAAKADSDDEVVAADVADGGNSTATGKVLRRLMGGHGGTFTGWIEPFAIYMSVIIICNVQAVTDYKKERMFVELSRKLHRSNKKSVLRSGVIIELPDEEIVVGDVISFNAHNAASLPADGVLLPGSSADVKMDESALTGEPEPMAKSISEDPFLFSGTDCTTGQGRMLVTAVGPYSVAGKIKMAVYGSGPDGAATAEDDAGDEDGEKKAADDDSDEEKTPLFAKLDFLANRIGKGGFVIAGVCFLFMLIVGIFVNKEDPKEIITYITTAITIVAVAVPEGLPLAVTLSLAFTSLRMYDAQNMVKTLASCETMGSATTICTDKTGTLTKNRMTVSALAFANGEQPKGITYLPTKAGGTPVGDRVRVDNKISQKSLDLICKCICVCSMDESQVDFESGRLGFKGNPTECALLVLSRDLGWEYQSVRQNTVGRNAKTLTKGKPRLFSSARKMMSWAVPNEGGWRIYAKGASEIILERVTTCLDINGQVAELTSIDKDRVQKKVITTFAKDALRTIGIAYKDVATFDEEELDDEVLNANGTKAYASEANLTLLAIVGIEDPLRDEVPPAIAKCYRAGIDVRMVTGDNLETAVAIARRANIIDSARDCEGTGGPRTSSAGAVGTIGQPQRNSGLLTEITPLKPFRAMEGAEFRRRVHRQTDDGETVFDQDAFDALWPYLRVLARSSPDDKLTLAKGLNRSSLYSNKQRVAELKQEGITIFPDRQVVAMTGDGTNDAPALKCADVGFAMGISGTQIAKDAADIILLDDNFASIVTAALWGRNVYDSISKFLQFQLTVNVTAVSSATVGAIAFQMSPLAAVQLLWVNLIMDSLASLALATEPPEESMLTRPPVNRSASIITEQMWANIIGHSIYQIVVVMYLLFRFEELPARGDCFFEATEDGDVLHDPEGWWCGGSPYDKPCANPTGTDRPFQDPTNIWGNADYPAGDFCPLVAGHLFERAFNKPPEHYTIIFTTFVLMQLFNEVNCRKLRGEWWVFGGVLKNGWFLSIWFVTFTLQIIGTQFLGEGVQVDERGMITEQWILAFVLGIGELPWQQVINVILFMVDSTKVNRGKGREKLTSERITTVPGNLATPTSKNANSLQIAMSSGRLGGQDGGRQTVSGKVAQRIVKASKEAPRNMA